MVELGDWGLGIGDWVLGIGDWEKIYFLFPSSFSLVPSPQSLIIIDLTLQSSLVQYHYRSCPTFWLHLLIHQ